jgi:GntR family transcriptional regulator of arabinose operon
LDSKNKAPLYQVIFNDLYKKIKIGFYKVGDQIPTEKELMSLYETSRITASRAVHELVNKNYVQRLKATGTFVNPEVKWEENKINQTRIQKPTVAFIIPSPALSISIEMEVLQGIGIACRDLGYALTIHSNESDNIDNIDKKTPYEFEKSLISELIDQGVVGAIFFPSTTNESPEIYNMMSNRSFPFVLLDRQVFGVESSLVTSDNRNGFYSIVEHVILKGHSRIAFVSGNTQGSSSRTERFYGFIKAMNDYKQEVVDKFVIHHLFPENHENQYYKDIDGKNEYYHKAIKEMLETFQSYDNPPTAIVTSNDYIALNIMSVAASLGYNIPDDISISGFDGLPISSLITPKLATVAQDFLTMGKSSINLLDQLIKNPHRKIERIDIPTKLVPGKSIREL